jgi:hypothetical protein
MEFLLSLPMFIGSCDRSQAKFSQSPSAILRPGHAQTSVAQKTSRGLDAEASSSCSMKPAHYSVGGIHCRYLPPAGPLPPISLWKHHHSTSRADWERPVAASAKMIRFGVRRMNSGL